MTAPITLRGAGYRYPTATVPSVAGVDLAVGEGELLVITGPTGCGKSTLLRLLAGLLQRHGQGEVFGEIRVQGHDPATWAPRERVRVLGLVGQVPGDQLVTGAVGDELAFGMESAGSTAEAIDARLPELLALVGLDVPLERDVRALSGGQTQRLMVGAALAAGGRVLLLDEPLAQLDPLGARTLLRRLRELVDDGATVVMVEHRLEASLEVADRLVVMEQGRVVGDLRPVELRPGSEAVALLRRLGLSMPGPLDLVDRLGLEALDDVVLPARVPAGSVEVAGPVLVSRQGLRFTWPGADAPALDGVDLSIRAGERVALLGGNGAGKSTLLASLAGALPSGRAAVAEGTVAVPQDPDLALFLGSVREELAYGPLERGLRGAELEARVVDTARALSIDDLLDRAPQALSRGQRLRTAVAAALACGPRLLLLDEPTSGQDHDQVAWMFEALRGQAGPDALVFATHDVGLALREATRVVVLDRGRVIADGEPEAVLLGLDEGLPVVLPPLVALCRERGWSLGSAGSLAAGVVGEGT